MESYRAFTPNRSMRPDSFSEGEKLALTLATKSCCWLRHLISLAVINVHVEHLGRKLGAFPVYSHEAKSFFPVELLGFAKIMHQLFPAMDYKKS